MFLPGEERPLRARGRLRARHSEEGGPGSESICSESEFPRRQIPRRQIPRSQIPSQSNNGKCACISNLPGHRATG